MKGIVYTLAFALVYPFLLPGFLLRMIRRGGYAARFLDRFALYPRGLFGADRGIFERHALGSGAPAAASPSAFVWIHAVSVGEVQVAGQLMRCWRKVEPGVRFCFSTTSSTGWKMALKEVRTVGEGDDTGDVLIYNPLDFPNFVKSAFYTIRPRAVILTESEIWPNFIRMAKRLAVPLFLINARVSDRSAPRYARAKFLFGDVFAAFTAIFAQSETDRARLIAAGARPEAVTVTGSFKFDVARRDDEKARELEEWIFGSRSSPRPKLLVGGSTWPGEDRVLVEVLRELRRTAASGPVALVLAPRHFEKADEVERTIRAAGFSCIRRSRGERPTAFDGSEVYLADTTGELMGLYALADVVFVGKSLCAHGAQNMIEPCLLGKPTVVGPYTENFRPVMSDLLAADALVQAPDAAGVTAALIRLIQDDGGLGARAAAAVSRRVGVVARALTAIREAM